MDNARGSNVIEDIAGFPIIEQTPTDGGYGVVPGRVVLLKRPPPIYPLHPYVVAWQGLRDGVWDTCWNQGTYCTDIDEAVRVYRIRVRLHGLPSTETPPASEDRGAC